MTNYLATIVFAAGALAAPVPLVQATANGHWEGTIQVPGQELQVAIDLKGEGKKWEGEIAIPAQGLKGFPLSDITVAGDAVSFVMKGVPGAPTFKGTLSKDGKAIAGDMTQGGGTMPFSVTRTGDAKFEPKPKSSVIDAALAGTWEGPLDVQGKVLRLAFKIARQADGTPSGIVISLDQGNAEIPIGAVVQSGTKVKFLVPLISGTFDGELKGDQLSGTWSQGPNSWPLVLTRAK
jgi:hypothetical protein